MLSSYSLYLWLSWNRKEGKIICEALHEIQKTTLLNYLNYLSFQIEMDLKGDFSLRKNSTFKGKQTYI